MILHLSLYPYINSLVFAIVLIMTFLQPWQVLI